MSGASDAFVKQVIEAHSDPSSGANALFPVFVQEIAPIIEFLAEREIAYSFCSMHDFVRGWSSCLLFKTPSSEKQVVLKWASAPAGELEMIEKGQEPRRTYTSAEVLNHIKIKLGAPTL